LISLLSTSIQVNCEIKWQTTHNENGQKMRCNANKLCATHCKPESKKMCDTAVAATLAFA